MKKSAIAARKLLAACGLTHARPVPLEPICRHLGAKVMVSNLGKLDGYSLTVAGQPVIRLNGNCHRNRRRYTLAHEISHIALKHPLSFSLRNPKTTRSPKTERQANIMAAELLVPKIQLSKVAHSYMLADLATMFLVSEDAMRIRLDECGLVAKRSLFPEFDFRRNQWR